MFPGLREKMGPCFMNKLAVAAVLLCSAPAGGYVYQMISDCEYSDDITDVVYFVKNVFNQKLNNIYDSRLGTYVGFGEYGMINANHYNNQSWKMKLRKQEVETLCRYNARLFRKSILDRKVPPNVKVRQTKPADYGERSTLECSVWGFYPQEVMVSWLRDGEEVTTDVFTSDVLANGDWSFQFHSYLELTLKRGERVSCRVDHSSLKESLEVEWDTFPVDVRRAKLAVGIVFFLVGLAVAAGGAGYYWWKQRFHGSRLSS
ncbi:class II histocompatibility antigen, B-L beta chain-like [Stegastes partitus]|nr:PREDICTED: class II histocompatibility antigen, B-L beta chain-like [Stegastes partitus]